MTDGENEFRAQAQFGRAYNKDDVIIFNISLHNPEMVVRTLLQTLLSANASDI